MSPVTSDTWRPSPLWMLVLHCVLRQCWELCPHILLYLWAPHLLFLMHHARLVILGGANTWYFANNLLGGALFS